MHNPQTDRSLSQLLTVVQLSSCCQLSSCHRLSSCHQLSPAVQLSLAVQLSPAVQLLPAVASCPAVTSFPAVQLSPVFQLSSCCQLLQRENVHVVSLSAYRNNKCHLSLYVIFVCVQILSLLDEGCHYLSDTTVPPSEPLAHASLLALKMVESSLSQQEEFMDTLRQVCVYSMCICGFV